MNCAFFFKRSKIHLILCAWEFAENSRCLGDGDVEVIDSGHSRLKIGEVKIADLLEESWEESLENVSEELGSYSRLEEDRLVIFIC